MTALTLLLASGPRIAAEPAATPRFEWMVDGFVNVTARVGNALYVGGTFQHVVPPSGVHGRLYAVSPSTGAVVPSIVPRLDVPVRAMLPDGGGGYYLHGNFTVGTGNAVGRVIHIRPDGSVDPLFNSPPQLTGGGVMVRVGPSLVVAGFFTIDGVLRPLVALDPVTGALSPWVPALPPGAESVRSMVVSNGRLFVTAAPFYGTARYVTAFDGITGQVLWETDVAGAAGGQSGALAMAGNRLIVAMGRLYSLDPATGVVDAAWATNQQAPEGIVFNLASDGSTVFACGTFTAFDGQPRSRLAAVDVASGALLPWSPQASEAIDRVTVSPSGSVFVSGNNFRTGSGTINGQTRTGGLFEIDGTGALTAFQLQVTTDQASAVVLAEGTLFVGGAPAFSGAVARQSLAAFDLTTGALLPFDAAIVGGVGSERPAIWALTGHDQKLHLRGNWIVTIGGQTRVGAASVDAVTGALLPAWSTPGLVVDDLGPYHAGWLYLSTRPTGDTYFGPSFPRRLDPVTGTLDPAWLPPPMFGDVVVDRSELLFLGIINGGFGSVSSTVAGSLDGTTGQLRELFRTTAFQGGRMMVDGDTLYLQGNDPATVYGPFDSGQTLYAFDRKTGVPVTRPPLTGRLASVALADGRFIVSGRNIHSAGVDRYGLVELTRTGTPTAWDGGFRPHGPPVAIGGAPGGGGQVDVHGDLLVATGAFGPDANRVAVFDLSGAAAPAALRSRSAAGVVEFEWVPPRTAPAGGYVIEGGFTPGEVAASLPVGSGTTFATQLSAIGPAFVRVRAQGSAEVSNEVVVGCLTPPLPPTALTTTMSGTHVTLAWLAPNDPVTSYTLAAGTASGLSDAATTALPGTQTSISGTVPSGTFFVRVQATNACGAGGPSGEVFMTIGAPDPLPAAPTGVAASVSGSTVTLTWAAPAGAVIGYVLEGGTALGLANIGTLRVGAVTSFAIPGAPAGVYAVRVRAITSAGSGAPSSDAVVVVP